MALRARIRLQWPALRCSVWRTTPGRRSGTWRRPGLVTPSSRSGTGSWRWGAPSCTPTSWLTRWRSIRRPLGGGWQRTSSWKFPGRISDTLLFLTHCFQDAPLNPKNERCYKYFLWKLCLETPGTPCLIVWCLKAHVYLFILIKIWLIHMFLENTGSHDTIKVYTELNVPDQSLSTLLRLSHPKKNILNTVKYLESRNDYKTENYVICRYTLTQCPRFQVSLLL